MMDWMDQCLGFQGGGIMMMLGMIVFWSLLIYLGLHFLKTVQNGKNIKDTSYLDILKQRLASGEITEEEFDRLKHKLH